MIIRVFRPTIHPGKEREFEASLRDTAGPLVSQQAGLVAQHVGRPRDPSSTEPAASGDAVTAVKVNDIT